MLNRKQTFERVYLAMSKRRLLAGIILLSIELCTIKIVLSAFGFGMALDAVHAYICSDHKDEPNNNECMKTRLQHKSMPVQHSLSARLVRNALLLINYYIHFLDIVSQESRTSF